MTKKICTRCLESKSRKEFHKATKAPDGLSTQCKQCKSILNRKRREKKLGRQSRAYGQTGKEIPCSICETPKYFHPVFISRNDFFYCSRECAVVGHRNRRWGVGADTIRRKLGKIPSVTLKELHQKSSSICSYCGQELTYDDWPSSSYATIDHVIPVSRGGTNDLENLCICCSVCNSSKGTKLLDEWQR